MVMNRRLNPDDEKKKNRNKTQPVNYSGGSGSNPGSMYQNRPSTGSGFGSSVAGEAARRAARPKPTGKNRPNKDKGKVTPGKPGKDKIPSKTRQPKTRQRNSGGR